MYLFDKDIALTEKDKFVFEGIVSPNWSINGNPNGGYLMAFLAAAMQRQSDKKWPVIVTANFLTRCETDKASMVSVEEIAVDKQLNRYQASIIQDGNEKTRAWATFMHEKKRRSRREPLRKGNAGHACARSLFIISGRPEIHVV